MTAILSSDSNGGIRTKPCGLCNMHISGTDNNFCIRLESRQIPRKT